tara:strand:+ start:1299 stop:1826 length:528 start_codon:yes stop_codon:yes gene_type:complete
VLGAIVSFSVMNTKPADTQETVKPESQVEIETETAVTPVRRIADAQRVVDMTSTQNLSGQGLTKVSGDVFLRTNTTVLNLSNNKLSGALPAEVRNLQQLRVLDLSNNDFTGVPAEMGQLAKLEELNLSHNPITGLPLELGNLQNLKVLDLRGTQYSEYDLGLIKESLPAGVEIRL